MHDVTSQTVKALFAEVWVEEWDVPESSEVCGSCRHYGQLGQFNLDCVPESVEVCGSCRQLPFCFFGYFRQGQSTVFLMDIPLDP
jgi:hypothetical protein